MSMDYPSNPLPTIFAEPVEQSFQQRLPLLQLLAIGEFLGVMKFGIDVRMVVTNHLDQFPTLFLGKLQLHVVTSCGWVLVCLNDIPDYHPRQ